MSYIFLCHSMDKLFIYVKKWRNDGQKFKKRSNVPHSPLYLILLLQIEFELLSSLTMPMYSIKSQDVIWSSLFLLQQILMLPMTE